MAGEPKQIQGFQFTGGNIIELIEAFGDIFSIYQGGLKIEAGNGRHPLYISAGTWIVKDDDGQLRAYGNEDYQMMVNPPKKVKETDK